MASAAEPVQVALTGPTRQVLSQFKSLSATLTEGKVASKTKAEALKDFERQLQQLSSQDIVSLALFDPLWRTMRELLAHYETQWDLMTLLINRVSTEAMGRRACAGVACMQGREKTADRGCMVRGARH